MITLITGTPGSGKTAYALDMMVGLQKLDKSRKLYVHGIPDLKIAHEIVTCDSTACDYCPTLPKSKIVQITQVDDDGNDLIDAPKLDIEIPCHYYDAATWHEWAEDGSILFFDEVQNLHRVRGSSVAVPPNVAAYEVHRHKGLDFFLITQNPSLIDSNVRALVSRHIHLSSSWARRVQFEFPQCKTDLGATTGEGIKSSYTLPKDVFSLYKSASLHTKITRKKPLMLYVLPLLIIFVLMMAYRMKLRLEEAMKPPVSSSAKKSVDDAGSHAPVGEGRGAQATQHAPTAAQPVAFQQPFPLMPSAPVPLDMPRLFKKWSWSGIEDKDLEFLPVNLCSIYDGYVNCRFPSNVPFRLSFSNVICSKTECVGVIKRIASDNKSYQRSPPPNASPISNSPPMQVSSSQ